MHGEMDECLYKEKLVDIAEEIKLGMVFKIILVVLRSGANQVERFESRRK